MMSRTRTFVLSAAVSAVLSSFGLAQDGPSGLDALSDDKLYAELATRNLQSLLNRAFEVNKASDEQKNAIMGRMALLRLQSDKNVAVSEARKLIAQYVQSLPLLLPSMNDPGTLMNDAALLISQGVESDQHLLEYFGPNAGTMARLRPVAEAVQKMLAQAEAKAGELADRLANGFPATEKAWEKADREKTLSEYLKNVMVYPIALATDPQEAGRAERITEAVNYLRDFDTDDNPERATVKFYIARLNLALGTPESLKAAQADFDYVVQKGKSSEVGQQFESRFLAAVADVMLKDSKAAENRLLALEAWAKSAGIPADQLETATQALRYRIALAANDNAKADDILNKLQESKPGLRGLILELMSARVKADAPVASLNPLLLQAIVAKAEAEVIKPQGEPFDAKIIERGIEAAREILKRKPAPAPETIDNNRYVLGFFYQKLGRKLDAGLAYLDYVDAYKDKKTDRVDLAYNNALANIVEANRENRDDPRVATAFTRVLKAGVEPPFNRDDLAFLYARRLQADNKIPEAVAMFRRVPKEDKSYNEAQYYLMVATQQQLSALKPGDPKHTAALKELTGLIDVVNAAMNEQAKNEIDPQRKMIARLRLAQTRLLGADVALAEQKQPARAIELLDNYEEAVKGLAGEEQMLGEVLLIRVKAYVQLGKVNEATAQLVKLAQSKPDIAGQIVFNLLMKLDEQITQAETAGRLEEIKEGERNRAMLTPFLVDWASKHSNPEIKKLTYTYSVFDADTQRRAAELVEDPAKKKELLEAALKRFKELDSEANIKQYIASLPKEKQAKAKYDPQVKFGLGRTYFAMGDFTNARLQFALLARDKVLGSGFVTREDKATGTFEVRDNPSYWEAMYKLIRSNLNLGENQQNMKVFLANLALDYGDKVGGERWKKEFEGLLKELEVELPKPAEEAPATTPADAPSAEG